MSGSSNSFYVAHPCQGPSKSVSFLNDSASLANQILVHRSNITPRQLAAGDSSRERSSLSGGGDSSSSLDRSLEPSYLASEGNQLRYADVVETILSARASSTRRSYALRWHVLVYDTPCRPISLPNWSSAGVSAREPVLMHNSSARGSG